MGAETAGRKLGIGLRLAAKAAQQQAAQAMSTPSPSNSSTSPRPAQTASRNATAKMPVAAVTSQAKSVAQGAKRFGAAVWGPMAHTGGVLWLEITGLFFGLFAMYFGQNVYRLRHSYITGPEHSHFLVYTALTILFGYFTFTSFYKARQKEKKNRARRAAQ
jgi:hypothetical protein